MQTRCKQDSNLISKRHRFTEIQYYNRRSIIVINGFLKFSSGGEVGGIAESMREMDLENRYAEMVGAVRKELENECFAAHLVNSWRKNIERCHKLIEQVRVLH